MLITSTLYIGIHLDLDAKNLKGFFESSSLMYMISTFNIC